MQQPVVRGGGAGPRTEVRSKGARGEMRKVIPT